jgi:hypothetical protein
VFIIHVFGLALTGRKHAARDSLFTALDYVDCGHSDTSPYLSIYVSVVNLSRLKSLTILCRFAEKLSSLTERYFTQKPYGGQVKKNQFQAVAQLLSKLPPR